MLLRSSVRGSPPANTASVRLATKELNMASANVIELNNDNWETEVVKSTVPFMLDLCAPYCGASRALGSTIVRFTDQFTGRVNVGKLNPGNIQYMAVHYCITSIPQILFYHN